MSNTLHPARRREDPRVKPKGNEAVRKCLAAIQVQAGRNQGLAQSSRMDQGACAQKTFREDTAVP